MSFFSKNKLKKSCKKAKVNVITFKYDENIKLLIKYDFNNDYKS